MKKMKIYILLISFLSINSFANEGENLFKMHCVSCHSLKMGYDIKDKSMMLGPPAIGIARKIKPIFNNEEQFIEFIVDYLDNPSRIKARLKEDVIKKFGLMPKEIGQSLTKEDKQKIARWMYKL